MSLTTSASSEEDLVALRESVRSFLETKSPPTAVREAMATFDGFDRDVWRQMAEQLGLQGLSLPEQYGGSGFGMIEQLIVFEELGRSLYSGPFFSTMALAAGLLVQCDDEPAKAECLARIASGDLIATVALVESDESWSSEHVTTHAHLEREHWRVSGVKPFVTDGVSPSSCSFRP